MFLPLLEKKYIVVTTFVPVSSKKKSHLYHHNATCNSDFEKQKSENN